MSALVGTKCEQTCFFIAAYDPLSGTLVSRPDQRFPLRERVSHDPPVSHCYVQYSAHERQLTMNCRDRARAALRLSFLLGFPRVSASNDRSLKPLGLISLQVAMG